MRDKDIKILWGRSGNRCAVCKLELTPDGTRETLGEMAHIVARSSDGPRGNEPTALADRDVYDNLILLCPTHHTEIDKDIGTWSVARLRTTKSDHERWVSGQLGADKIRVATFDNTEFLARRQTAWVESSRGQVALVVALTPLRVSGDALNTLDQPVVELLEGVFVPASDARAVQVNKYRTRPTEFGVANEDFPKTPHSHGYSVQIFRVGHCEYLCEFGAGVDHITGRAKERGADLMGATKVVRYTDIAIGADHGIKWLSEAWDKLLPFNYMTFSLAITNTELTTLYSREVDWRGGEFGFVVKSPVLIYSEIVAKGFDRSALLLQALQRMANSYGMTLDRVYDDAGKHQRPTRMR